MSWQAFILLLLTAFFWGLPPIMEKAALGGSDPVAGLTIRQIAVTLILIVFVTLSGRWEHVQAVSVRDRWLFILSGISAGLLGMVTYYYALRVTPASRAVPISASYPLVAAILAVIFLGEKMTAVRLAGIVLIVSGVYLVR